MSFCKILLELCLLMGGIPNFWRGEEKFTATPWRLFYGAGGEAYHARGCKYISYIMGVFLYHGVWVCSSSGGGFQISDFS